MKESTLEILQNNRRLYIFSSPDGRALFSLLSIKDYYLIKRIAKEFPNLRLALEEDIWKKCVIEQTFGSNEDNMPAGIISTLAQVIMLKSCPTKLEQVGEDLDAARVELQDMIKQLILKVCEAFPAYNPEDVYKFDWYTLMERVAEAEKILGAEFELNGKPLGKVSQTLRSDLPTKQVNGMEVVDFDAINKEVQEA